MSATRDKNQNPTFVYTNLYRLYRDGETERKTETHVLKTGDHAQEKLSDKVTVKEIEKTERVVRPYQPVELIGKRVGAPAATTAAATPAAATPSIAATAAKPAVPPTRPEIQSLKDNLKKLNDLHQRLRFMLNELEDLSKKDE